MAEDRSRDEAAVRALDDQERIAALHRDVSALERLWSEEFIVNAPNNRIVAGRKSVLDTFVHAGIINFSTFERDIELVKVDGPFVIIMGLERLVPISVATRASPAQLAGMQPLLAWRARGLLARSPYQTDSALIRRRPEQ
jgi:hypothetical protein